MAGLVPAIHVVRRIELFVSAARAKALCLAKLSLRAAPCRPVFEALPAWIAGTSPAITARAETIAADMRLKCGRSLQAWTHASKRQPGLIQAN
jgi:hypothetical protein